MGTKTNILKDDVVLNYIKENLNNNNLISKIKEIVASKDKSFDIPDWHKEHVLKVIKNEASEEYISENEFFNLIK